MKYAMEKMVIPNESRQPSYRESQGDAIDREILGRYRVIINYFAENPERAATEMNHMLINNLAYNDVILSTDVELHTMLFDKVLNAPQVIAFANEKEREARRALVNK